MQIQRVQACGEMVDVAVGDDGRIWVLVRRVCDVLGIDFSGQRQKLLTQGWASEKMRLMNLPDATGARMQQQAVIDADALPMWLGTIDEARVREDIRPTLARFQREARDALAAHFGMRGAHLHASPTAAAGSGGAALRTVMSTAPGSGGTMMSGAAELLAMVKGLTGALEATLAETAAATATATAAAARAEAAESRADDARFVAGNASALADDAQTVARLAFDEARRAGSKGIPVARRRAAVGHITRAVRAFCAKNSIGYTVVYAELRRDLGLPRKQDGGPALGTADLRADQIIRLARCANNMGVPDCGAHVIESILSGGTPVPPTIDMAPSSPARAVDSMQDFVTSKPNGPVQ